MQILNSAHGRKTNCTPLKYYALKYILSTAVPILLALSIVNYIQNRNTIIQGHKNLQEQTERDIVKMLKIADSGYLMLEKSHDRKLEKNMKEFLKVFTAAGPDKTKIDLENLKMKFGSEVDLYIINKDGVIINTTYNPDKNLDFKKWPLFYKTLQEMMTSDEIILDRYSGETQTGKLRRYVYQPSPDHNYILEFGLIAPLFSDLLSDLEPSALTKDIQKVNPSLIKVRLLSALEYVDGIGWQVPVEGENADNSDEIIQIVKKLYHGSETFYETFDKNNGYQKRYIFLNLFKDDYITDKSKIIELTYSDININKLLMRNTLGYSMLSIIFIILCIPFVYFTSKIITEPIHDIINSVDSIANGNLDCKIPEKSKTEILVLEKSINIMMDSMLKYINQIKDNEKTLKEYSADLEKKVEERTVEVNAINSELQAAIEEVEAINDSVITANHDLEEQRRIADTDMKMAVHLQRRFFPQVPPLNCGWDVAVFLKPLHGISGDFYDFYQQEGELCGLSLFDVSGHGISSGLITLLARSIIYREFISKTEQDLSSVISDINDRLIEEMGESNNYLTGIILRIINNDIFYVNAGHPDLLLKRNNTEEVFPVMPTINNDDFKGPFLGMSSMKDVFHSMKFSVETGDVLLLHSDCLNEGTDRDGRHYGISRISKSLSSIDRSHPAVDILSHIIADFETFTTGVHHDDDLSVIVMKKICHEEYRITP